MRFAAWTPTGLFFLALEETTITADSKMAASEQAPDGREHPHMDVSSRLCPSLLEKLNHWVKRKNNSNQPKRNVVLTTRQIL